MVNQSQRYPSSSSLSLPQPAPGGVHDGVDAVGDGDGGAVGELPPDGVLDEVVGLQVHGGRGLVQHQHAGLPEERPGEAHQLPLPDGEVLAALRHGVLQAPLQPRHVRLQVGVLERLPHPAGGGGGRTRDS